MHNAQRVAKRALSHVGYKMLLAENLMRSATVPAIGQHQRAAAIRDAEHHDWRQCDAAAHRVRTNDRRRDAADARLQFVVGNDSGSMIALPITATISPPTAMSSAIICVSSLGRRWAACVSVKTFEQRQFRQDSSARALGRSDGVSLTVAARFRARD